jgi:anhydro-N-acetylmuramic acid kinase
MKVLGIMSGTSLGSVDYALCDIEKGAVQLRDLWSVDYPKPMQKLLHQAARGAMNSWEFSQLHHDLGRFYAEHAVNGKIKPQLVGVHGQTVFHNPGKKNPATFQLGEPAYLAEKLRAPVVNNFRSADIAAGGQGAPLATIFHKMVFSEPGQHVCVNNLGGISNVTSIDWRRKKNPKIAAFDTGPANMLIDFAMRHFTNGKKEFDENGAWAEQGKPCEKVLKRWLKHPYFRQKPPKSTGRELFGEPFFNAAMKEMKGVSKFDVAATFMEFTARSLALNYKLHLGSAPQKVILTGGGASNPALMKAIAAALNEAFPSGELSIMSSEYLDWPVQAIEPAAFALLAWLRFENLPGNIPETTGAKRAVLCGQITGDSGNR